MTTKTERKKPATAATPWGNAAVVDEAKVAQRVGDKRFATVVQLLEAPDGEPLVRIAYTTDGVARRGPVTLRARDLERLRAALEARPALASAVGLGGGEA
jgi:hypothetical protein